MVLVSASSPGVMRTLSFLRYLFNTKRANIPPFVSLMAATMITQIVLGLAVAGSDIWLHLTSRSVDRTSVTPIATPATSYGRALSPDCTAGTLCAINVAATNIWIRGIVEGLSTLNNVSSTNTVKITNNTAFLLDSNADPQLDYQASTIGMQSVCQVLSTICQLNGYSGAATPYDCGSLYPGVSGSAGNAASAFLNLTMIDTTNGTTEIFGTHSNPFYASVAATVDTANNSTDPDFVIPVHGNRAILLWCDMRFLDIVYIVVGGNVRIVWSGLAPTNTAHQLSAALATGVQSMKWPLWLAAEMDAVSGNASVFADLFALDLSKITMAIAAGVMVKTPTAFEAKRESAIVSRLPKGPLVALVTSLLLFFLLSLTAILVTLLTELRTGNVITTVGLHDLVKSRLCDPLGIVQECFGDARRAPSVNAEEMFKEGSMRDAVIRVVNPNEGRNKVLAIASEEGYEQNNSP